jgi:pimeloyl-ACP methyl ester carboxylesterase
LGIACHEVHEGQRPRPAFFRPGPTRRASARLHQFARHGLRIWNEVAEILAPDFRVITYDKRGHGLSESGPDRNDIADYARDLSALLDHGGAGRATIVGLSIGASSRSSFIARDRSASSMSFDR